MDGGPEMENVQLNQESVQTLRDLGLGEYEIKAVAALVKMGPSTVRDILEVTTIPRTKIYEAVKSLESKGWVHSKQGRPMRVRLRPIGEVLDDKRKEMENRLNSLEAELEMMQSMDVSDVPQLVIMTNMSVVLSKVKMLIEKASEEVFIFYGFGLDKEMDILDKVVPRAVDRGVRVKVLSRPEYKETIDLFKGHQAQVRVLPIPYFKVFIVDWERAIIVTGRVKDGRPVRSTLVSLYNPYTDFINLLRNQMESIWSGEFYTMVTPSEFKGTQD